MKRILQNKTFAKGTIRGNLLSLASGTIAAQTFSLVFYPILSRLFSPADFGLLSVLGAIAAIITVIASGRYEEAIIIAKNEREIINIAFLALFCSVLFCVFSYVGLHFFPEPLATVINNPSLQNWLYLAPIISFLIIIYNVFNEQCVKKAAFSSLAINKITNSASINLSKFAFGSLKISGGLIYGELLGRGLSALSCIFHWLKQNRNNFQYVSFKEMKNLARVYINFPKFAIPDQLVNAFTGNLPVFFLSAYFGSQVLGYYAMAMMVLAVPMTFLGQAIMDVLKSEASRNFEKNGNCREVYSKLLKKVIPVAIVLSLSIFYFLPNIFTFVLGKEWQKTGEFVQILYPSMLLNFIALILMPVWVIAKKQKERLYWKLFYFLIMLIAVVLGIMSNNVLFAIGCISAGFSIAYLTSIYFTWKYSKGTLTK
ncbi:MAG: oligosaccharide flippase family protein [Candidatus Azobacteroides sp.]|nr:oligosaccharide flippase family protein [Candidatus Azobacteroides sp.]